VLPFSLSALRLDRVSVTESEVEIDATREGLELSAPSKGGKPESVQAVVWNKHDHVEIVIARARKKPGELQAALRNEFSVGFDEQLASEAPDYWQPWLRHDLTPAVKLAPPPVRGVSTLGRPEMPLDSQTHPPTVLRSPDPQISQAARKLHYQGIAVPGLIVDTSGRAEDVYMVRPLGMGLDEAAVEAVRKFRFRPAEFDGKPVPVRINIEMNFRIR
jgi:TonB family protein